MTEVVKLLTASASSMLNTAAHPNAMQDAGPRPSGAPPSRSSAARIAATPPAQRQHDRLRDPTHKLKIAAHPNVMQHTGPRPSGAPPSRSNTAPADDWMFQALLLVQSPQERHQPCYGIEQRGVASVKGKPQSRVLQGKYRERNSLQWE